MEISGEKIKGLVAAAEEVSRRRNIKIAIAPPQHLLAKLVGTPLTVLAQHVDNADVGGTTGYVIPEMLKESGVGGSIINHSEHRISEPETTRLVARLKRLGMISVVCAKDVAEVERLSAAGPDYVAIEPPELIGSGRAVSKERPELIEESVAAASTRSGTVLLCGAGIVSGEDVGRAIELGAGGILVASGIVKGRWDVIIDEFARAVSERA